MDIVDKASEKIKPDDKIELKESPKYVSRGDLLEHALKEFKIDLEGTICLILGPRQEDLRTVYYNKMHKRCMHMIPNESLSWY